MGEAACLSGQQACLPGCVINRWQGVVKTAHLPPGHDASVGVAHWCEVWAGCVDISRLAAVFLSQHVHDSVLNIALLVLS